MDTHPPTALAYGSHDCFGEAVQLSESALGARGIDPAAPDLSTCGMSLFVSASEQRHQAKRTLGRGIIAFLAVTGCCLVVGIGLLIWGVHVTRYTSLSLIYVRGLGVAGLLIGWALICCGSGIERAIGYALICRRRPAQPAFRAQPGAILVGIEDGRTIDRVKASLDDVAILHADPRRRLIVLEGIGYRAVIRAEDVVQLSRRKPKDIPATLVSFKLAATDHLMSLAFVRNTIVSTLKHQFHGRAVAIADGCDF